MKETTKKRKTLLRKEHTYIGREIRTPKLLMRCKKAVQ